MELRRQSAGTQIFMMVMISHDLFCDTAYFEGLISATKMPSLRDFYMLACCSLPKYRRSAASGMNEIFIW